MKRKKSLQTLITYAYYIQLGGNCFKAVKESQKKKISSDLSQWVDQDAQQLRNLPDILIMLLQHLLEHYTLYITPWCVCY